MASDLEACLAESGTVAFRVAFRLLRSREDAEDVSQEAVVRALQRFDSLRDRTRFRAWLVRVAWRLAIDRRRSDWRRLGRDTHLVSTGMVEPDAERDLMARERAAHVRAAVDQLPAKLRTPLVLGNMEGRSLDEVAALLQLPAGTVKSRSFEARKRLKQTLLKAGVALALSGTAIAVMQRLQFVERSEWPALAPASSASAVATLPPAVDAPMLQAKTVGTAAPVKVTSAPDAPDIDQRGAVVTVSTVDVPVVIIPLVKIPAVQVPVVDTITTTVPSGHMEKQR